VLGKETFKTGLTNYFEKFQWKNTELGDFVSTLDEAYNKSGDKSMGPDFNFKKWCDEWLLTSGVNILEPIVEYGPNDTIKSLSIMQKYE
jgi:aminopeptidase N